jgi:hypothetical protein
MSTAPPATRRGATALGVAGLLLVAGAILGFYLLRANRLSLPVDSIAAQTCRADYSRARTGVDTATIDSRRPITSRAQAPVALTCGALRRSGRLTR